MARRSDRRPIDRMVGRAIADGARRGKRCRGRSDSLRAAERQRDDGGWGWLSADESDAFGTGVALYAVRRDGLGANHPAIARGRQFLISSQQADGAWLVKGTKKNKATQIESTSTYWGTCWGVIGLGE